MRIIFDQATPVPIRPWLKGHVVRTAAQQGRDTLRNGDLLNVAEQDGFDLLLTTDKNMRYQQNLAGRIIAIVVLGQQQWPKLRPQASRRVNSLRYLLRLAGDLGLLSRDSQEFAAGKLEEIGRMVGGWRKARASQQ